MNSPTGPLRSIPLPMASIVRSGDAAPRDLARPIPENRRRLHRVSLVHGPAIRVEVRRADGRKLVGVVEDCCWSGLSVRFVMQNDPRIKPEQIGVIVVTSLRLPDVKLRARVASAQSLENGCTRYGLQFLDEEELVRQVTPEWRRWYSQRRKPRFTPMGDMEGRASIAWRGGTTYARIADVSGEGIGVEVDLEPARSIVLAREIALLLSFPGSRGVVLLPAVVRGSKQGPTGVRLGLEYLPGEELDAARSRLETWIERMQARDAARPASESWS